MIEALEDIRRDIALFLQDHGINPVYIVTIFALAVLLSHWGDFKKWEDVPDHERSFLKALSFGTVILVAVSILLLTGAI